MDVSIIVPIYNVEDYIEKCILSIENQTFQGSIECILIDDCGSDQSITIAEDTVKRYKGSILFKILHHKCNKGLSAARNTGIHKAVGSWLYFLDSDDTITPDCIASMYGRVKENPLTEMVQAGAFCIGSSTPNWFNLEDSNLPDYTDNRRWICRTYLQEKLLPMTAWNRLIRKDFVLKNQLFFENGYVNEDILWTYLLARNISHLAILKKNTYLYLQREGSITSNRDKIIENWMNVLEKKVEYYFVPYVMSHVYRDLEFSSIVSQAISKMYDEYSSSSKKEIKIRNLLLKIASVASFRKRLGLYLYCYAPYFLRHRVHYVKFIHVVLNIKREWQF